MPARSVQADIDAAGGAEEDGCSPTLMGRDSGQEDGERGGQECDEGLNAGQ